MLNEVTITPDRDCGADVPPLLRKHGNSVNRPHDYTSCSAWGLDRADIFPGHGTSVRACDNAPAIQGSPRDSSCSATWGPGAAHTLTAPQASRRRTTAGVSPDGPSALSQDSGHRPPACLWSRLSRPSGLVPHDPRVVLTEPVPSLDDMGRSRGEPIPRGWQPQVFHRQTDCSLRAATAESPIGPTHKHETRRWPISQRPPAHRAPCGTVPPHGKWETEPPHWRGDVGVCLPRHLNTRMMLLSDVIRRLFYKRRMLCYLLLCNMLKMQRSNCA